MIDILLSVVIMALVAAFLVQEYRHSLERKDLLIRIMARDLNEYNQVVNQRPPPKGGNFIRTGLKRYQEAVTDAGNDQG